MPPKRKTATPKYKSEAISRQVADIEALHNGKYAVDVDKAKSTLTPVNIRMVFPTANGEILGDRTYTLSRETLAAAIPGATTDSHFHVADLTLDTAKNSSGKFYSLEVNAIDNKTGATFSNFGNEEILSKSILVLEPGTQHVPSQTSASISSGLDSFTSADGASNYALYSKDDVEKEIVRTYDDDIYNHSVITAGGILHQILLDSHTEAAASAKPGEKVWPPKPEPVTTAVDEETGEEIATQFKVDTAALKKALAVHKDAVHDKYSGKRIPEGEGGLTFTLSNIHPGSGSFNAGAGYIHVAGTAQVCCLK